jgi:hypothetical protein
MPNADAGCPKQPPGGNIHRTVGADRSQTIPCAQYSSFVSCSPRARRLPRTWRRNPLSTATWKYRSWQRIRHVIDYSWYIPKLTYEFRASYEQPSRVSIERISGDLRTLRGSWVLQSEGDDTIAHYAIVLAPGFWVPHWIVRAALRRDLPKMLRALRTRAETEQAGKPD